MQEVFDNLTLPEKFVDVFKHRLEKYLKEYAKTDTLIISERRNKINQVQKQIENLELKYLNDEFEPEAYFKWKSKLSNDLFIAKTELASKENTTTKIDYDLSGLLNMGVVYKVANTIQKQSLVLGVFNNSLYYYDGLYRTPYMLELFNSKALVLKEKRLLEYEQPLDFAGNIPTRRPYDTKIERNP